MLLRKKDGLRADRDGCLMREPLTSEEFSKGRIQAGQATQWMRALPLKLGAKPEHLTNIGSHSCKTTLLSVAAKGGLSRDTRRVLGGHTDPAEASVNFYSRDALAQPVYELAELLGHIRDGRFDPDASFLIWTLGVLDELAERS